MATRPKPTTDDRRNWPRHELGGGGDVVLNFRGEAVHAKIEDISLGGVRVLVDGVPPKASAVTMQREGDTIFEGDAVWDKGCEVGIQFRIPESEVEHLLQCIRLVLAAGGGESDESSKSTDDIQADLIAARAD
jgi:hypothetical protein